MTWIRRGYGVFVRCKNTTKAKRRAAHWKRTGQGDKGAHHPVIGLFTGRTITTAKREELFA